MNAHAPNLKFFHNGFHYIKLYQFTGHSNKYKGAAYFANFCSLQDYRFNACDFPAEGAPLVRVDGGSSRQGSVANGLAAVHPDAMFVAVHDGARPMVTTAIISECYERAREFGAASAARRVTESLKRSGPDGFSRSAVGRENLWVTETPQIFRARILRRAYQMVADQHTKVTDEVSAVELLGISTFLVQSRSPNPKITHPWDLDQAASLLK